MASPKRRLIRGPSGRLWLFFDALFALLRSWLSFLNQLRKALHRRLHAPHPWQINITSASLIVRGRTEATDRVLRRQTQLQDDERIAEFAANFRQPESDFFTDLAQVHRLMERILEENPPWLYVSRVLSGGDAGSGQTPSEFVFREQITRTNDLVQLFIPYDTYQEQPLSSLTLRPTRHLDEVFHAKLLDQVLPPEVLVDRHSRGEIMIPTRVGERSRIEFRSEVRRMNIEVRKPVPIAIETEQSSGTGGQLLYILLDYSASMRGLGAVLAMAVISAVIRANMGQSDTRYLFRRYANEEEIWPRLVEPPVQARTVAEKDLLLKTILATNFNGGATHVNHALEIAATDVRHLRQEEQLNASILLVTDGRAEILNSTGLRLREAEVTLHTVMVSPERHPGLEAISESFTSLDISLDMDEMISKPAPIPEEPPLPSFKI